MENKMNGVENDLNDDNCLIDQEVYQFDDPGLINADGVRDAEKHTK